jgi:hypothetical protein
MVVTEGACILLVVVELLPVGTGRCTESTLCAVREEPARVFTTFPYYTAILLLCFVYAALGALCALQRVANVTVDFIGQAVTSGAIKP